MRRISRRRLALATLAAAVAAGCVQVVGGLASGGGQSQFAGARNATARFHNLPAAEAAGFAIFPDAQGIACIDNRGTGGMGVHYANGSLIFNPDGSPNTDLDPAHPEALVYAPNAGGQLRLAALEYIVFQGAWDATHSQPPELFGQTFNLTPAGNRFGIPAFYSLHAWVWEPNSDGMLQPWNPRVHC
ncbi:MAG TPA: hypothetical protein VKB73_07345 [Gaiellaceae bacterium]|nr:hypothetical protein [Gaiellaceae bacterium]